MLKVIALNRRVMINRDPGDEFISNETCNALIAIDDDKPPVKAHFNLNDDEASLFDELCLRIERRLINDISNQEEPALHDAAWLLLDAHKRGLKIADDEGRVVTSLRRPDDAHDRRLGLLLAEFDQDNSEAFLVQPKELHLPDTLKGAAANA
jgi:hypothetical protein